MYQTVQTVPPPVNPTQAPTLLPGRGLRWEWLGPNLSGLSLGILNVPDLPLVLAHWAPSNQSIRSRTAYFDRSQQAGRRGHACAEPAISIQLAANYAIRVPQTRVSDSPISCHNSQLRCHRTVSHQRRTNAASGYAVLPAAIACISPRCVSLATPPDRRSQWL